ncbi:enolase C-terminal domain-like protein [Acuticoccus sp. MNP-M23]|uniref:enolase C-terminal domain-like protein n=1 Tax=Acuticoccus sp. MNP-M23 TaxID=3072793 RepID=UPI0028151D9E|nr:enolase C-terminal domain-like protein [Acuticoccus sp. MNP-M23]WMS41777.1 enolase C-terminal domain-like protein [Acuticoccus sp. MNP-M23]
MTDIQLIDVSFGERPVRLRLPFRFGVITLREARQVFVKAHVRCADGREGEGISAELLIPKWFDKSADRTNEDNVNQLRQALRNASAAYMNEAPARAFALHAAKAADIEAAAATHDLPPLVASYGPALLDRALIDALCRIEGVSVFDAVRQNRLGISAATAPDLEGFRFDDFLKTLVPARTISLRHTVGMVDPLVAADQSDADRLNDGLPETLEEVIAQTGVTHFKLKVGGDVDADVARLKAIAAVIDRCPHYAVSLDGNEQFKDAAGVVALWDRIAAEPDLARLRDNILFIEQPIARASALSTDIAALAAIKPVEIDESDGFVGAFPAAKALGYQGISSKSCKGFYRAIINRARCDMWNEMAGEKRYFMSAEDLTTQAGIALQQDLALASLIGCTHVERNGHHYVSGMAGVPDAEADAFVDAHGDLYRKDGDAVRLRVENGQLALGSLHTPGLGSAVIPDFGAMTPMPEA